MNEITTSDTVTLPSIKLRTAGLLPRIESWVRELAPSAVELSNQIAALAEPPLQEFQSAALLEKFLTGHGFEVRRPWKKLPTAFVATKGRGKPVIQVLAEYDALPDCGPRTGLWGHGCGHNLLGAAAALSGVVTARALEQKGLAGQVAVVGTPAEETLGGKVFIGELGGYKGVDAMIVWHPATETFVDLAGLQAMDSILFEFGGRTAHAAGGPHKGRSALDAAMLMDVAVNYLREHVEDNTRMHCVIVDGGKAPNVVPDRAVIWYYIRGRDRKQVDALRERVVKCAQGAALATETTWKMDVLTCCTERLVNRTMGGLMESVLAKCGMPKFTPADIRQCQRLSPGRKIAFFQKPLPTRSTQRFGSSDEDNASWFAPMGKVWLTCMPKETVGHHRDEAALAVSEAAHKGMAKAAEMMSLAMVELFANRPLLKRAQAEYRQARKGKQYNLPLSKNAIELSQALSERSEGRRP